MTIRPTIAGVSLLLLAAATAAADPPTPADAKPTDTTPPVAKPADAKPASPAPTADPSLDELLGLPTAKPAPDQPAKPADPGKAELTKQLSPEEAQEEFAQAVALMDQVAQRLADTKDKGLDTQRLQADVLRKLDKLIDSANRNKKNSKSSSKQQQQQQQDQQQSQKQSSQAQQQQQQQQTNQGGTPNVPRRDGSLNTPPPAGAAASWGNLPPHVRDALLQGFSDRFSSVYKSMTEEYYKRLAEEKKSGGVGGGR